MQWRKSSRYLSFNNLGIDFVLASTYICNHIKCIRDAIGKYFIVWQCMLIDYYIFIDVILLVKHITITIIITNTAITIIAKFNPNIRLAT